MTDKPATLRLKPAPDRRVRHPGDGRLLDPAGETVPADAYWLRRLKDADVVQIPAASAKKEA